MTAEGGLPERMQALVLYRDGFALQSVQTPRQEQGVAR